MGSVLILQNETSRRFRGLCPLDQRPTTFFKRILLLLSNHIIIVSVDFLPSLTWHHLTRSDTLRTCSLHSPICTTSSAHPKKWTPMKSSMNLTLIIPGRHCSSVRLSVGLSGCRPVCRSFGLSVFRYVGRYVRLSVCLVLGSAHNSTLKKINLWTFAVEFLGASFWVLVSGC